jgi:hypothetical protein
MDQASLLIERARAETSLTDFGEDSFREGLDILVASLAKEARLSEQGAVALDAQLVAFLSQRLQIEHWYAEHPEIDDQEIVAPLIGLGLPRTGSTALQCLLGEDPSFRTIRSWEASYPLPPPEKATEHTDPRIAIAEANLQRRNARFPKMKAMLPGNAQSPTECFTFMAYDFKSQILMAYAQVPTYNEWLIHKADFLSTYRYVKRVLKLLQWRCPPNRWRLNNRSHMLGIEALDQVFPDARYWMSHRDVASVIPSGADLYLELMQSFSDDIDRPFLGRTHIEFWDEALHRLIAFREAGNDHRFFDLHFAPFQRDPIAVVADLYAWLGEDLTDEARARMVGWRTERPRDKHGLHEYQPSDFGLSAEGLREHFRFYTDRFGVMAAA